MPLSSLLPPRLSVQLPIHMTLVDMAFAFGLREHLGPPIVPLCYRRRRLIPLFSGMRVSRNHLQPIA